jgi:hypothetical protein
MGVGAGTGRTLVLCSTDSCTMGFICNSRSVSMTAVAQEFDGTGCNKMRVSSLFSAGIGVLLAVAKCCQVERLFFSAAGFEGTLEDRGPRSDKGRFLPEPAVKRSARARHPEARPSRHRKDGYST